MNFALSKPSPFLSRYVKHYWGLEHKATSGKEYTQRVVPSGLFELIIYLEDRPRTDDDRKSMEDNILLTGQLRDYYDLKISGSLSLFCINFHPHGLAMFLDLPLHELFEHSIPLRLLLKDRVNSLEDQLSRTRSHAQRILVAEEFLLSCLQKSETKHHYDRIRHCVDRINRSRGNIAIESLASDTFLSRDSLKEPLLPSSGQRPSSS